MSDRKKPLIIFDLDETLIHSRQEPLGRDADYVLERLHVYFRPNAVELILAASKNHEIAVWSAGSPLYVDSIVSQIFPAHLEPLFIWNREHCSAKFEISYLQTMFSKDLHKMRDFGYDLKNTLIIEDDPLKIRDFGANAIIVSQYFGEEGDDELSGLVQFIEGLNGHGEDVRDIGLNWKTKILPRTAS
ncbi:MAG: HAD family hydrolase [Candidatus Melainabacteria bacterium]|nr:HAD family hydrolase [Candidatus Melainabacteria bacterium]